MTEKSKDINRAVIIGVAWMFKHVQANYKRKLHLISVCKFQMNVSIKQKTEVHITFQRMIQIFA